ncbi:MAG: hypothetical protein WBQ57_06230, partial [Rhodanobacteraceae bacterium]
AWLAVAATIGVFAVAFGGAWRFAAISPGGLVAAHEPIPPPDGARNNCGACHVAADDGLRGWITAAFASDTALKDSKKCLGCHFRGKAEFALAPHSVAPAKLDTTDKMPKTQGRRSAGLMLAALTRTPEAKESEPIPCATCHQEHRGAMYPIAHLDNTRCQACHRVVFDNFAGGHPEFGAVHHTRSGILFDHRSHKNTYFGKDQPFECSRCHKLDAARRVETTLGYETSCAGCHHAGTDDHHGTKIRGSEILALQLPDLGSGLTGVSWSSTAPTGTQVPGPMQLLLAGDAATRPALASLMDSGGDPSDWPDADDDSSLRPALAAGVERLMDDMLLDSHTWLRRRVAKALGVAADADRADNATTDLEDAVNGFRGDISGLIGSVADAPTTQELVIMLSQPATNKDQITSRIRDLACSSNAKDACLKSTAATETALKARNDALDGAADAIGGGADDPKVKALFADAARAPVRMRLRIASALAVAPDDARVDGLLAQLAAARSAVQEWRTMIANPAAQPPAPADSAGWSVRPKDGTLIYRPIGHADAFMRAYIDAAITMSALPKQSLPTALRDSISDRARSSECLRCHAVDRSGATATVNWQSAGRDFDAVGFSNFVHGPHVDLIKGQGCAHCHVIAKDAASGKLARGLLPHPKAVCAECHNPGQTNADCVTCHRYHRVAANE